MRDNLPPIIEHYTGLQDYLLRKSAHRTTSVRGRRCHRCGKQIEYCGVVKPGIPYVWCVYCWSPSNTER